MRPRRAHFEARGARSPRVLAATKKSLRLAACMHTALAGHSAAHLSACISAAAYAAHELRGPTWAGWPVVHTSDTPRLEVDTNADLLTPCVRVPLQVQSNLYKGLAKMAAVSAAALRGTTCCCSSVRARTCCCQRPARPPTFLRRAPTPRPPRCSRAHRCWPCATLLLARRCSHSPPYACRSLYFGL